MIRQLEDEKSEWESGQFSYQPPPTASAPGTSGAQVLKLARTLLPSLIV